MTSPAFQISGFLEQQIDEAIGAALGGIADDEIRSRFRPLLVRNIANSSEFIADFLGAQAFLEPSSLVLASVLEGHLPRLVEINIETRKAVKLLILRRLGQGEPLSQIASQIRPMVGLTSRMAAAVDRFRTDMLVQGASEREAERLAVNKARSLRSRRARLIARTESGIAWSRAGWASQRDAGAPARVWITSRDARVRPSHKIDSQCALLEEPFTLASGVQLMHPHDPSAPIKEIADCRCAAAPLPVACAGRGGRLGTDRQRGNYSRRVDQQLGRHERGLERETRRMHNAQAARIADELGRRAAMIPPVDLGLPPELF